MYLAFPPHPSHPATFRHTSSCEPGSAHTYLVSQSPIFLSWCLSGQKNSHMLALLIPQSPQPCHNVGGLILLVQSPLSPRRITKGLLWVSYYPFPSLETWAGIAYQMSLVTFFSGILCSLVCNISSMKICTKS